MLSFPLAPERGARLLVAAARQAGTLRGLGDVPGHEFHGNQWTEVAHDALDALESKHGDSIPITEIFPNYEQGTHQDAGEGQMQEVPVSSLVATQSDVSTLGVFRYIDGGGHRQGEPARVVERNGKHYVVEGHHRLAVDILKGRKTVKVMVHSESHTAKDVALASHESPLHRIADQHEPKLAVAFRYAFAVGRKALGRPANADRAAGAIKKALAETLAPTLLRALAAGGEAGAALLGARLRTAELRTAKDVPGIKLTMRFDAANRAVIDWADRHAAELIDGISETSREQINNAVANQAESGEDSYDEILDAVGDEDRAQRIAHHEAMLAANEGQRQAWDQAVDGGLLAGDEERVWITTPDEKLCPICEGLEDTKATLGASYEFDGEEYDGPPAHVGCRCTEGLA